MHGTQKGCHRFLDFETAVVEKNVESVQERNDKMKTLVNRPFFREAHPKDEHFVQNYIATGAGTSEGEV
jgi:aromatic ring-opening dioxygenase catalytic subunit (LigB family)